MRKVLIYKLVCVLGLGSVAFPAQTDDPRITPVVVAYRRAKPAVVSISARYIRKIGFGPFGDDPFKDIFPFARKVQNLGSGFVIHPDGYIVTNAHVVRRAEKITVTAHDNTEYDARVISADSKYDLAVLKIDLPSGRSLAHLPLGRSDDLMVGETVIAIGNPLGYANTLTTGVISAINRTQKFAQGVVYSGLIQIDAPINPGNSGGPLLNVRGELIGVNTAIRADAQNIGFAISVDTLAQQLGNLLNFERINRVVFGAKVAQRHGAEGPQLYVTSVAPGSPADGKLRAGDRIVALDGDQVRDIPDFTCAMLTKAGGKTVSITALRDGKRSTVAVPIKAKPKPDGKKLAKQFLGMTLREVTPQLAQGLNLPTDTRLLVVGLDPGGPADKLGLELKDIVFQVGNFYVKDLDSLGIILEDFKPGQAVKIGIARGNVRAWAPIRARGSQ